MLAFSENKNKRMKTQILIIALVILGFINASSQSAYEIIKKSDELRRGEKSSYSEMTMKVIRPKWSRTISFKTWTKGDDYSLALITSPAKEAGQSFLNMKKEMWNWNPTINRIIKLPPSMLSEGWMGSDFTNDDLVRQSSIVEDYTHTLAGEEEMDGYACYKLELIPKPEAGVVWGKIITWITKEGYMQLRADHYDEDMILIKSMIGTNVQTMGGRTFPIHWEMIPHNEPGQKTVMDYLNIEFNINTKESFYSQQNMKRVR